MRTEGGIIDNIRGLIEQEKTGMTTSKETRVETSGERKVTVNGEEASLEKASVDSSAKQRLRVTKTKNCNKIYNILREKKEKNSRIKQKQKSIGYEVSKCPGELIR